MKILMLLCLVFLVGCRPEPPVYAQPPWRIVSEVMLNNNNPGSIWKTVDSDNGATIYVLLNNNGTCSVAVLPKIN